MVHPRVAVTDIETVIGTRYTAETILCLQRLYPGVRFVWLMGADNLASFHQWDNWREIFAQVPIGVLARPGQRISARMSVAAAEHARFRLSARAARLAAASPDARLVFCKCTDGSHIVECDPR